MWSLVNLDSGLWDERRQQNSGFPWGLEAKAKAVPIPRTLRTGSVSTPSSSRTEQRMSPKRSAPRAVSKVVVSPNREATIAVFTAEPPGQRRKSSLSSNCFFGAHERKSMSPSPTQRSAFDSLIRLPSLIFPYSLLPFLL